MTRAFVWAVGAAFLWTSTAAAQTPTDRPEYWREDLRIITNALPSVHANLYFQTSRDSFQSAAARIENDIPALSDQQIIVRMAELVAMVGDAHTNLSLSANPTGFRLYPIRIQWFDDGLFVIAALPGAAGAIGKRIVSIGGAPVDEAYSRVGSTISAENEAWRRRISQDYLVIPEVLHVVGLVSNIDAAEFVFQDSTGATSTLQLAPVRTSDARNWIYVPDLTTEPVPLYRKQNNQNYWLQYLGDSRTLYFKYNTCTNSAFLPFTEFTTEFLQVVDENPIERFVFDLRNNTGGNSGLILPLLEGLEQRYLSGKLNGVRLFVIIGRETFSSGLLNALQLKAAPVTVLVGEPSGGKPNHYGQVASLTLPRSGMRVTYSMRFFTSSITTPSLNPDVHVPFPSSVFFENRDPYLETALESSPTTTIVAPFVMYMGGGSRLQSAGTAEAVRVGYGTISSRSTSPFGFGIVRFRQQQVTISEATVAPSIPLTTGSMYVEVAGRVNTGIALANTSETEARVSFQVTNESGQIAASGALNVPSGSQIARFLSEEPFNVRDLTGGALTFASTVPVAVLAIRGLTNERDEFLLSTLSVSAASTKLSPVYCAHFANGAGWTTQINLLNPSDQTITGSFEFVPGDRFTYVLPPRSARRYRTSGEGSVITGFVRITPGDGSVAPVATSLFSYRRNGVTVTEASVHATTTAQVQTMIVSGSGGFSIGAANAVMSGVGVANPGSTPLDVQLTVTSLAGSVLGTGVIQLPGNGQRAVFLDQLLAGAIAMPFEGTLSITSNGPIAATGLRGQYNERGDFLISATPIFAETPGTVFAHFADGGGYSTRFMFVARTGGVAATLRFRGQDGTPLPLDLRD